MTVEAAFVLPLFIFCMAQVLYVFDMIRLQSNMTAALHEAGDAGLAEIIGSAALSETWVRSSTVSYLGKEYLDGTCLEGGAGSISYLQSSILAGTDEIDLIADYRIKPFLEIFGLSGIPVQSRYYSHAWVGYDVGGEPDDHDDSEETVYITESGTVYHRSRDCTYLRPSAQTVDASVLSAVRNRSGSKYYPCEICHPSGRGPVVITRDGNRYHSSVSCPGIKRTVREVPLSSVEGKMPACSKCGGEK